MSILSKLLIPFLLLSLLGCNNSEETQFEQTVHLVDPFLGTGGHGHTYPGATTPFGMVQLSPDNGTQGWDWVSGYHWSDSVIVGFSHTHLSGTGIGDWADISVQPILDNDSKAALENELIQYSFDHANEEARPGYYKVTFDNGIQVELSATKRVGIHRYRIADGTANLKLRFDMGFAINWDESTDAMLKILDDSTLVGYRKSTGWSKNQEVYFAARFNGTFAEIEWPEEAPEEVVEQQVWTSKKAKLLLSVQAKEYILRVGLSSASIDGAIKAIEMEAPHQNFDQYVEDANALWANELNSIRATFKNPAADTIFATALYHTSLAPNLYSDANGSFKAVGGGQKNLTDFDRYTVFSLWDTFRATHPLFLFTQSERLDDFLQSVLSFYDESGLLPVWALSGHETNTMTGYHAVPVLAEAILKGRLTNKMLVQKAYEAMKKSAMQDIRGTNYYLEYGYIPADLDGWSVTKTLEYAYDDWCIAKVAAYLGEEEDETYFLRRAKSYEALFDSETHFMRAKDSKGNWVEPFDPYYSEHGFEGMYIEGTAWQHSWFVPHDVAGLISLFGSKEAFTTKLDSTFETSSELRGENVSVDISGLIGQYAHGNEPSHHVAYLYSFADEAWKTQQKVRQIMNELYTTGAEGLSGNDDCGQMSAWYIFSALGFYHVDPVSGQYILGSPLVEQAVLNLPNGKQFKVETDHQAKNNIYVQSVKLNGVELQRPWITYDEIMQGGVLHFSMSEQPNKLLYK